MCAIAVVTALLAREVLRLVRPPAHEYVVRVPREASRVIAMRLRSDDPITVRAIEILAEDGLKYRITPLGQRGAFVVTSDADDASAEDGGSE